MLRIRGEVRLTAELNFCLAYICKLPVEVCNNKKADTSLVHTNSGVDMVHRAAPV